MESFTRTIDPPIKCGFEMKGKVITVEVVDVTYYSNGDAPTNRIKLPDGLELDVVNSSLLFGKQKDE